jgi:hypothetical protein
VGEKPDKLGIQRMVVVQASVSGTDNMSIDASFSDALFRDMHDRGIRGGRFDIAIGGGTPDVATRTTRIPTGE